MSAFAGPAPWYQGVPETYKNGRRKNRLTSGDQEWNLTEGWHAKRRAGWYKHPGKNQTVKKRKVTAPDGKQVELYVSEGYDDAIGFGPNESLMGRGDSDAAAYAYAALDKSNPSHGPIESGKTSEGHIQEIEYAVKEQVMRVTFANGGVCLFFRVPSAVAGLLLNSIKRGNYVHHTDSRGIKRHAVGSLFWDLVRIRHQRYGARYPFQYERRADYALTNSNKRYLVKLTDRNFSAVLGKDYNGPLKPGDTVLSPLTQSQYEDYIKFQEDTTDNFEHAGTTSMAKKLRSVNERGEVTEDYTSAADQTFDEQYKAYQREKALEEYAEKYKNAKQSWMSDKDYEELKRLRELVDKQQSNAREAYDEDLKARLKAIKDKWIAAHPKAYQSLLNRVKDDPSFDLEYETYAAANLGDFFKKKDFSIKKKYSLGKHIANLDKREAFSSDAEMQEYNRLRKFENAPAYAKKMVTPFTRIWTKNELEMMANPSIPGALRQDQLPTFKAYLKAGDYENALEYLKTINGNYYVNGKFVYNRRYAGPGDRLKGD